MMPKEKELKKRCGHGGHGLGAMPYDNVWGGGGMKKSEGRVNLRAGTVVVTSVSERGTRQNVTRRWQKVCHNGALTLPWFFGTVIA